MRFQLAKSKWELSRAPLRAFLARARAGGFTVSEIHPSSVTESPAQIAAAHAEFGMKMIAQISTEGTTPRAHADSLEPGFAWARACGAMFLNSHTGRDHFTSRGNTLIFRRAAELSASVGLECFHETHRARALYSLPATAAYLEALPRLELTLDLSHWLTVHESDLSDQSAALGLALRRTRHIHARFGHPEGPQLAHPFAREHQSWRNLHLTAWRQVAECRQSHGDHRLTITPEFGPAPYWPGATPDFDSAEAAWQANLRMRTWLRKHLFHPAGQTRRTPVGQATR
jgi:hypothetical protein